MIEIKQIPVLRDNYIYLVHLADSGHTVAVDPAEARPVLSALAESGWSLTHIFNTHHHADHVGAISNSSDRPAAKSSARARIARAYRDWIAGSAMANVSRWDTGKSRSWRFPATPAAIWPTG